MNRIPEESGTEYNNLFLTTEGKDMFMTNNHHMGEVHNNNNNLNIDDDDEIIEIKPDEDF